MRSLLHRFVLDFGQIAWGNRGWLCWNTFLALLPAVLAVWLFSRRGRGGPAWWAGVAAFVLLLPNAPYVVSDLVHLRSDVVQAHTDSTVYLGVLPMYVVFIAVGFGCYAVSLHEVGEWLRRSGRAHAVRPTELTLHLLSAVGVLIGRALRLNSWDAVMRPWTTVTRSAALLSWHGAPVVLVVLFAVFVLGTAITRALAGGVGAVWNGVRRRGPTATAP